MGCMQTMGFIALLGFVALVAIPLGALVAGPVGVAIVFVIIVVGTIGGVAKYYIEKKPTP